MTVRILSLNGILKKTLTKTIWQKIVMMAISAWKKF
jgi:hypothetical protein